MVPISKILSLVGGRSVDPCEYHICLNSFVSPKGSTETMPPYLLHTSSLDNKLSQH